MSTEYREIKLFAFMHSGNSYLLNILLELGICIHGPPFEKFWKPYDRESWRFTRFGFECWGMYHPIFQRQSVFSFKENLRVHLTHFLPSLEDVTNRKALFVVRDPRGSIHSSYKRLAGRDLSLSQFLNDPIGVHEWQHDNQFELGPADEWAFYNTCVTKLFPPKNLCVVRFEELRESPVDGLSEVLAFLEVERTESEIARAVEASSHENVAASAQAYYERHHPLPVGQWRAMQRGVEQWKDENSETELKMFGGVAARTANALGYSLPTFVQPFDHPLYNEALAFAQGGVFQNARNTLVKGAKRATNDEDLYYFSLSLALWDRAYELYGNRITAHILERCRWLFDNPIGRVHAAEALFKLGRRASAREWLDQITADSSLSIGVWMQLGRACKRMRYWSAYHRALESIRELQFTTRHKINLEKLIESKIKMFRNPLRRR